jgi:hypothetical protein
MADRVKLQKVTDAERRVTDMLEHVDALKALLEHRPEPLDRPWHAQVRARLVALNRLYPVKTERL